MKKLLFLSLFFLVKGISAQVTSDWRVPLGTYTILDYSASTFKLTSTAASPQAESTSGSNQGNYTINTINITPPTGKESAWLAMLLSSLSTGGTLRVYGTGSGGILTISNTTTLFAVSPN